jgi:hypothetical protein
MIKSFLENKKIGVMLLLFGSNTRAAQPARV